MTIARNNLPDIAPRGRTGVMRYVATGAVWIPAAIPEDVSGLFGLRSTRRDWYHQLLGADSQVRALTGALLDADCPVDIYPALRAATANLQILTQRRGHLLHRLPYVNLAATIATAKQALAQR